MAYVERVDWGVAGTSAERSNRKRCGWGWEERTVAAMQSTQIRHFSKRRSHPYGLPSSNSDCVVGFMRIILSYIKYMRCTDTDAESDWFIDTPQCDVLPHSVRTAHTTLNHTTAKMARISTICLRILFVTKYHFYLFVMRRWGRLQNGVYY